MKLAFNPNMTLTSDNRIQLSYVETTGTSVKEMVENADLYFEDWNGNALDQLTMDFESLSEAEQEELKSEFYLRLTLNQGVGLD